MVGFEGVEVRLVEDDMEFEILGLEELPVIVHELGFEFELLLLLVVLLLIGLMEDSSTSGYKRSPGPTKITACMSPLAFVIW